MKSAVLKITLLIGFIGFLGACSRFSSNAGGYINGTLNNIPMCPNTNDNGLCGICGTQLDLTWTAPTTNTDGSELTDLAGFNIYYGNTSSFGTEINLPNATQTSYTMSDLAPDSYYVALTAYASSNGQTTESAKTNTIGVQLEACTRISVDPIGGRVEKSYMPPKIIDTKVEPFSK